MSNEHADEFSAVVSLNEAIKRASTVDVRAVYSRLMSQGGICPGKVSQDEFGSGAGINQHLESRAAFSVTNYENVTRVLTDTDAFSVESYVEALVPVFGMNVLAMDGADHQRQRSFLNPIFSAKNIQLWTETIVRPVISSQMDKLAAAGAKADLVKDLCLIFPFSVLSYLLGLPRENLNRFHRLAIEILGAAGIEAMFAASATLGDDIRREIARRRVEPGVDLVSALVAAEVKGERLGEEEIVSFLKLLFSAGAETTSRSSANLLTAVLTHPDQLAAVRADRSLIGPTIEESLRWESPVGEGSRMATKDVELSGVHIPKGSIVYFYECCANRDPAAFEKPEQFDIRREPKRHLAFGHRRHLCLGQSLARAEMTTMLTMLLDRFPNLRLDPDAPAPVIDGVSFRSPANLHVRLD